MERDEAINELEFNSFPNEDAIGLALKDMKILEKIEDLAEIWAEVKETEYLPCDSCDYREACCLFPVMLCSSAADVMSVMEVLR